MPVFFDDFFSRRGRELLDETELVTKSRCFFFSAEYKKEKEIEASCCRF